ncbi:MAG TPA: DNA endonuclease SmrA [Candidatus Avisuccinivibrio pullicola]|nr:DNA endonuclease SmrA [Candidatus Avisuccinivibrio pullicola]
MQTPPEDFGALLKESAQSARDSGSFEMHAEFGDIKPLKQDRLIIRTPLLDKATAKVRQDNATRDKEQEALDEASSAFVHMVDPNDVLSFRRDGVQPYMLRKLKNGEYREADYIDLHGKTIEEAYNLVMRFIDYARREELRCVLIIHGKGDRFAQKDRRALLKSYVNHWLRQLPDVLAFHSAPEWKGGSGSVMVILKKSDKQSAQNRELHARR